jgi:hypothetical protein
MPPKLSKSAQIREWINKIDGKGIYLIYTTDGTAAQKQSRMQLIVMMTKWDRAPPKAKKGESSIPGYFFLVVLSEKSIIVLNYRLNSSRCVEWAKKSFYDFFSFSRKRVPPSDFQENNYSHFNFLKNANLTHRVILSCCYGSTLYIFASKSEKEVGFGKVNELPPDAIGSFKYAPIQSCDVERSFSMYKNVLADNRTNFTPENLEMYLICHCNE